MIDCHQSLWGFIVPPSAASQLRKVWRPLELEVAWNHELIGGLDHVLFFHILGLSYSQLTNSIIFQRGRSTTNQITMDSVGIFQPHLSRDWPLDKIKLLDGRVAGETLPPWDPLGTTGRRTSTVETLLAQQCWFLLWSSESREASAAMGARWYKICL